MKLHKGEFEAWIFENSFLKEEERNDIRSLPINEIHIFQRTKGDYNNLSISRKAQNNMTWKVESSWRVDYMNL